MEKEAGQNWKTYRVQARLDSVITRRNGEQLPLHYYVDEEGRIDNTESRAARSATGESNLRLSVRCRYTDCSGSGWLTTSHEAATEVLGMTADRAAELDVGKV